MIFSSSVMSGMGISLGGLEIATDFLYANSDMYEPELTEVKSTISHKPCKPINRVKPIKPKASKEAIAEKFNLISKNKQIKASVTVYDEVLDDISIVVEQTDDFDYSFDDVKTTEEIKQEQTEESAVMANDLLSRLNNTSYNNEEETDEDDIEFDIDDDDLGEEESDNSEDDDDFDFSDLGIEDDTEDESEDDNGEEDDDGIDIDLEELEKASNQKLQEHKETIQQAKQEEAVTSTDEEDDDVIEFELGDDEEDAEDEEVDNEDDIEFDLGEDSDAEEDIEADNDEDEDSIEFDLGDDTEDEEDDKDEDEDDIEFDIDDMDDFEMPASSQKESQPKSVSTQIKSKPEQQKIVSQPTKQPVVQQPVKQEVERIQTPSESERMMAERIKQLEDQVQKLTSLNAPIIASNVVSKDIEKDSNLKAPSIGHVESKVIAEKPSESKYDRYTAMQIDVLYKEVREFAIKLGVKQKPVEIAKLEEEFGAMNIRKLVNKSYIIKIGKGATIGR